MTRLLAYFLTVLLLLQSFGRELLVLNFAVNQASIAQKYCVNKARPSLRCNGKCFLAKQLRRTENGPAKNPSSALAKVKFEVVTPVTRLGLRPPVWVGQRPLQFARPAAQCYAAVPLQGVFHPPVG